MYMRISDPRFNNKAVIIANLIRLYREYLSYNNNKIYRLLHTYKIIIKSTSLNYK